MADKPDETTPEVEPAEVTEDDLKRIVGEAVDERLSEISDSIGGLAESIVGKLKGDGSSDDSLLEKIGGMIDDKLKGVSSGGSTESGGNGKAEREPKIKIFR